MEAKNLPAVVLVLVLAGILLATGMITLSKFDRASRDTTTVVTTGYNLTAAGTKDFSETYCIDIKSVANSTTTFTLATYNVKWTDADACKLSYDAISGCGGLAAAYCNITYTYGADNSQAGATTVNVVTALAPIASSWMPLLVTVAVLAIILGMVLSSFTAGRN